MGKRFIKSILLIFWGRKMKNEKCSKLQRIKENQIQSPSKFKF